MGHYLSEMTTDKERQEELDRIAKRKEELRLAIQQKIDEGKIAEVLVEIVETLAQFPRSNSETIKHRLSYL